MRRWPVFDWRLRLVLVTYPARRPVLTGSGSYGLSYGGFGEDTQLQRYESVRSMGGI